MNRIRLEPGQVLIRGTAREQVRLAQRATTGAFPSRSIATAKQRTATEKNNVQTASTINNPAASLKAIQAALGLKPSGDPANDVAAARAAFNDLIEMLYPAQTAQLARRHGITPREVAKCLSKKIDPAKYARTLRSTTGKV